MNLRDFANWVYRQFAKLWTRVDADEQAQKADEKKQQADELTLAKLDRRLTSVEQAILDLADVKDLNELTNKLKQSSNPLDEAVKKMNEKP